VSTSPASCPAFDEALASLRQVRYRSEVNVDESPAPQRLAPFAIALTAEVLDSDDEVASGRLVLLHDPAGVDSWSGDFRIVAFARAELEPELAADPLLTSIGWAWLIEAMEAAGAESVALGGTVTRVTSEGFGSLSAYPGEPGVRGQVEIRASWTPSGGPETMGRHARAWAAVISQAAGLLPTPMGVAQMPTTVSLTSEVGSARR
jgi:hypothetical protein